MLHLISALNLSGLAYTIEYTSPRFLLALVGAIVLVGGVWHADRSWDEKGSAAYNAAMAKGVPLSKEAIDASFPFPWAFLLGWALYSCGSCLASPTYSRTTGSS